MVHIYAAQYFLVTSYWRCPTDRVWSKFLSLIHPAIIKELSRKDFGLALQTKKFNIFDRQTDRQMDEKKHANRGTLKSKFLKI